jgi:hypothetical protein
MGFKIYELNGIPDNTICIVDEMEGKIQEAMSIPAYILNPEAFKGLIIITEETEVGER